MSRAEHTCTRAACKLDVRHPQRGEPCQDDPPRARSASYELGRARGYVTGRAEPTERDAEWWASQPGVDGDDDYAYDDFETGMLDGRDQATSARLRLPCPAQPTPEALAAAREQPVDEIAYVERSDGSGGRWVRFDGAALRARFAPVVEPGRIVRIEGGPEGPGVETWVMAEQPCQPTDDGAPTRSAWLADVVAQLERDAAEAEARGDADGARQATVIREQIAKHRAEMATEQSLAAAREGSS